MTIQEQVKMVSESKKGALFRIGREVIWINGDTSSCADVFYKKENVLYQKHWIFPLPLSTTILGKLGFSTENYKEGYIGIKVNNFDIALRKPEGKETCFVFEYVAGGIHLMREFEYAHDLQNWFYAMFKVELVYKAT